MGDMSVSSATGPRVDFMWGDCAADLKPGPQYGVLENSDAYLKHFSSFVAERELCKSQPSVVVFTIGICEIDRSTFDAAQRYVRTVLRRVAETCSKPHRVIVMSEMAIHQESGKPRFENAMSNERIIMINDIVQGEAQTLGLEFLDAYKITSSYSPNDSWDPMMHYYPPTSNSYAGNAASREIAKMLLASFQGTRARAPATVRLPPAQTGRLAIA